MEAASFAQEWIVFSILVFKTIEANFKYFSKLVLTRQDNSLDI